MQTDAEYVDVIHSNGDSLIIGGLGAWEPIGRPPPTHQKEYIEFRTTLLKQHRWIQELQRDVVYLGPIEPSYISPNAGGRRSCRVSANEYSRTQEPK